MGELGAAFATALGMVASRDPDLMEIIALTLRVSLSALVVATLVAIPLGAVLGVLRFPGRRVLVVLLHGFLGLPPVVVGLLVYLALSRSGPLGFLSLLYSPTAMVVAQVILITPIVAAITRQTVADLDEEYDEQLRSLGVSSWGRVATLVYEGRYRLVTALLAGLGRGISEVGAVMIVGGNIAHLTRVMTTAITTATRQGDLEFALALGLVLIALSILLTAAAHGWTSLVGGTRG